MANIDLEILFMVFVSTWWFTNNTVIQDFINKKKFFRIKLMKYPKKILTCMVCLGWFVALGVTQDFFFACFAAFVNYIYNRLESQLPYM